MKLKFDAKACTILPTNNSHADIPAHKSSGRTLFVTYRLAGSIPQPVLREYKAKSEWLQKESDREAGFTETQKQIERIENFKREWFKKFENILDQAASGPMWMKDDRVASVVAQQLYDLDDKAYTLHAF